MGGAGEVVSPQETEADYESDFELDKVDSSRFSIREGVTKLVFLGLSPKLVTPPPPSPRYI